MNRRDAVRQLSTGLLLASPAATLWAQGAPQEGRDYVKVAQPVPVPEGKVEVVEFFGYWCPHCNAFEPMLDAWARKLNPAQVNFRRIPVAFQGWHENYQRLYYGLEALGALDANHRKVFTAIHVEHKRFDKDGEVADFAKANGIDGAKLLDAMKSFTTATKVRQARALAGDGYRIDSVPTLGIQGRWMTSPATAGSPERALAVVDALIAQSRKS